MRIALVTGPFLPSVGGAEYVVHHLANAWSDAGHAVCVFNWESDRATHPEARYAVRRYPVLRGATRFGYHRAPWGLAQPVILSAMLHRYRPDMVSAHYGYPCGTWLSAVRPRLPYLVTCHGAELTPEPWGLRAVYDCEEALVRGLSASRAAIALSSHARGWMEAFGVAGDRIVEIPNGVEVARFAKQSAFNLRSALGIPERARVVLTVAREHPTKGHDITLAAHAELARTRRDVWQVFVGNGTDALRARAQRLGIDDRVATHPGLQGEALAGAFQQADVYVLASRFEVSPLTLLEAMAAGRAVVTSRVSGAVDLVRDGDNGFTAPVGDAGALAEGVARLLDDDELRGRMGARNRELAAGYDWAIVARRYLACFEARGAA